MRLYKILPLLCGLMCSFAHGMEEDERETEPRKEEKLVKEQSQQNEPFDNEKEKVEQELINAAQDIDLLGIQNALSRGAHINFHYLDGTENRNALLELLSSNSQAYPIAVEAIRFLLSHGAVITTQEMVEAATYADTGVITDFISYGGNFARASYDMLASSLDMFRTQDQVDPQNYQEEAIRRSRVLLSLLMLSPLNKDAENVLKICLDKDFTEPDDETISLRDKLTPLLRALIFNYPEEKIKQIFEKLNQATTFGRHNQSYQDEIALNEALVFAAAHGNQKVLGHIVKNFKNLLRTIYVERAIEAAAILGQVGTFQALITSNLLNDFHLERKLKDALLTAAAQQHENVVRLILETDREQNLNLDMLPVGRRLDFFITNKDLPQDVTNNYAYIRDILADYIHQRYVHWIIMHRKQEPQQESAEKEKEEVPGAGKENEKEAEAGQAELSDFLQHILPPEILALLITFLRFPQHKWKP